MADNDSWTQDLWVEHTVEETQSIYRDWANTYDEDVLKSGYVTPQRIAAALAATQIPKDAAILDFGCGTGLSGLALAEAGFQTVDGTDISPEMLDHAHTRGVYRDVVLGDAGAIAFESGTHQAVVAAGVVSAGAAPPATLALLAHHLTTGGYLAVSFNDPSLKMGTYDAELERLVANGLLEVISRDHGPHLPEKGMGSDVTILRRL
ncbi:class I SAM-dependent DNA methyltransferase [Shimia ponticola]|uniref:class I SAM-dependent DNA methyltransferase n=1 Tax=Shimia ponticola TaxID=2582893 RepID=UPI0011BEA2FE|nr:class I SAM-dependent methyltransferase [Shimia ponticola]